MWNLHKYVAENALAISFVAKKLRIRKKEDLGILERFMIAKLNSRIKKISAMYDAYELDTIPSAIEDLFLTLSRTYIQLVREKLSSGSDEEKEEVVYVMCHTLVQVLKMFYPVAPFICERMYLNLKEALQFEDESITLLSWPNYDERLMDPQLEHHMEVLGDIVQGVLASREKSQMGVRWPLQELIVVTKDEKTIAAVESLSDLLKTQVNVKDLVVMPEFSKVDVKVKADFGKMGPDFGENTPKVIAKLALESPQTIVQHLEKSSKYVMKVDGKEFAIVPEYVTIERTVQKPFVESTFRSGFAYLNMGMNDSLEAEGYSRELIRRVQNARKNAGLEKADSISLFVKGSQELVSMLKKHVQYIKEKVGATMINISSNDPANTHEFSANDKIKNQVIDIFFNKV